MTVPLIDVWRQDLPMGILVDPCEWDYSPKRQLEYPAFDPSYENR